MADIESNAAEIEKITPRAWTEKEAATYLGLAPATLRQARCYGDRENHTPTPPFIRMGRSIRYLKEDLDSYLDGLRKDSRAA